MDTNILGYLALPNIGGFEDIRPPCSPKIGGYEDIRLPLLHPILVDSGYEDIYTLKKIFIHNIVVCPGLK